MARTKKTQQPTTTVQQLGSLIKSARDIMRKDKGLAGDIDRLPILTWIMFLKFLDDLEQMRETKAAMSGKKFYAGIEPPYRWRDWAAKEGGITGDELIAFVNNDEVVRPDGTRGLGLFAYLRSLESENGDRRDVIASVFRGVQNRMLNGYLLRDVIDKVNGIHFNASEEIHTLSRLYEVMLKEMRDASGDAGEFYTPRSVVRFMVDVMDPKLGETVLDPACGTGGFLVEAFTHLEKQCETIHDREVLQTRSIFGGEPKPLPYLLVQMNLLLHGLEYPKIDSGNSLRFPLREIGDKERVDVILTNPPFGGEEEKGIQGNFPEDKQTSETALLFLQLIMRKLRRQPKAGRAAVVVPESLMGDKGVAARVRKELIDDFNLHTIVRLPRGVFEPYSDIQTNLLFFDRTKPSDGVWVWEHEVPPERQAMRNPCYTQTSPLRFEELLPIIDWWNDRQESDRAWFVAKEEIVRHGYSLDLRNPKKHNNLPLTPGSLTTQVRSPIQRVLDALKHLSDKEGVLDDISAQRWERQPLRAFLTKSREEATVLPDEDYKQITVKLYGKGAILRTIQKGEGIKTRPQFLARSGQLIMSRIDARNGAFALVPQELDGGVVTQDFPLFDVNREVIDAEFVALLLSSQGFVEVCRRASRGTTNRKRLKEDLFLDELVPIPSKAMQRAVVELMRAWVSVAADMKLASTESDNAISRIANSIFG